MRLHRKGTILTLLLALLLCLLTLLGCGDDETYETEEPSGAFSTTQAEPFTPGSPERRAFYTQPRGNGEDVVTLMFYMCGSDLETDGGCATNDINEILYSTIAENVNILIETGGALEWQNSVISSDTNQRYLATEDGLALLENVGRRDMTDPDTLRDFISFSAQEYPADRYFLILWDHGGGTEGGYAVDEHFSQSDPMSISQMNTALAEAGVIFDFIGFDCCLMGTAETAFMVEQHADYMIASQRIEPGGGWYYTDWITMLSENTSIPTLELATRIADDFIEQEKDGYYGRELTLSVIDLTYINTFFESLYDYFVSAESTLINDGAFAQVSQAAYDSRTLTDNYDQVDIAYLVENMQTSEAAALLSDLRRCIAYNASTIANHNGLCIYFPYTNLENVSHVISIYNEIGIHERYQSFISTFASLMAGGQIYNNGGSGNPYGSAFDSLLYELLDWFDSELVDDYETYYEANSYDESELEITDKGEYYALVLSEDDWDMIINVTLEVFYDDDEGYIYLGSDDVYEFDDDGDLVIDFDNTWVALDGHIVCYYAEENGEDENGWYSYGVVPCYINDVEAEIVIWWDEDGAFVLGARHVYHSSISQKGLFDIESGDVIEFLCEYYTYDEEYEDSYIFDELIVDGELEVSYEDVGEQDCLVYYALQDIYQNIYWTESVLFYS